MHVAFFFHVAMYRTDSNQVVLEPLTPLMPLTFDPLRQPTAMASLARVLMALGVAGWGLAQRLLKFTRPDDYWLQACQQQGVLVRKLEHTLLWNYPPVFSWPTHVWRHGMRVRTVQPMF